MPQIIAHAGPGRGPQLQPWPLLVWLEDDGVCTEDLGIQVGRIAAAWTELPDPDGVAARFGTTPEHVRQALSYLRSNA